MAIDANILLQGRVPDAGAAFSSGWDMGQRIKDAPIRNKMLEYQAQQKEMDVLDQKTKSQLQDMALDAMKIRPLLETGDTLRANVLIAERIKKIQQRGGDPSDTMAFRDALNSGQITPQQAIGELDSVLEGARQAGVLEGASSASMRSYEPRPMVDENGNFTGYAIPIVDAAGNTRMQPIPGSERAMSPIDLAAARENIGVQGYGQRRQIEAQTAPIIAGGSRQAELEVDSNLRPKIEADIAKAKAEAEDLVSQTISKRSSSNTLDAAQVLKANLTGNLGSIYGRGESLYPDLLRSQKGIDLIADRNQLVGMLTLSGRGQLKGQGTLTDSEQKTVQQAITVLSNPDISPARAEMALNDAFQVLEMSAGRSSGQANPNMFQIDGVTVTRKK